MRAEAAAAYPTSRGAKRRLKPTMIRSFPVRSTTSRMPSTSARVSARGFSTNTALPCSSARHTKAAWEWCRVTTKTASIAGSASTSSASVVTDSKPNLRWALTADSDRVVATRASVAPGCFPRCGSSIDDA